MDHRSKRPFHIEELPDILGISGSRIITLVGAGGKTTLMEMLGQAFSKHSLSTLITTTTHIMRPVRLGEDILIETEDLDALARVFTRSKLAALGIPCTSKGAPGSPVQADKWSSPSMEFLERIAHIPDQILCEGDGSRRMPVKIPRSGEPVFYPGTDTVIGVIGLSCLYRPVSEFLFGNVFPDMPSRATPALLHRIALSTKGLRKDIARNHIKQFHVIFNQADSISPGTLDEAAAVRQKLRDNGVSCHIVSLKDRYVLL